METRKGILVHVLRNALGDCTNGGITSKHNSFVLLDNPEQRIPCNVFAPRGETPPLYLVKWYGRHVAIPEDLYYSMLGGRYMGNSNVKSLDGWTAGGNFVYSSDSRYHELTDYPIPVYDRKE